MKTATFIRTRVVLCWPLRSVAAPPVGCPQRAAAPHAALASG